LLLVLVLVFGWCEHVQGAMTSAGVVPDLDVVVDRGGASSTRVFHLFLFRSSTCMRAQNASTMALSNGEPTAPIDGARPASLTFWLNTQEANWADSPADAARAAGQDDG
jgi:hypothetical protein